MLCYFNSFSNGLCSNVICKLTFSFDFFCLFQEICATEESLSDSSHDLESDYAPSSPDSSDDDDTPKKKFKETMVAEEEQHTSSNADTEVEDEEDEGERTLWNNLRT